jgi:hypothetical protein
MDIIKHQAPDYATVRAILVAAIYQDGSSESVITDRTTDPASWAHGRAGANRVPIRIIITELSA